MESFSWSDSLRALTAPCLDCLHSSKDERNDLEDLLADSGSASATTADAETLSLHSNPSSPRRKRTRFTKHIRLFGWDLFGRRQPIRLPDDDEEDEEENGEGEGDGGQEQVEQRRKKKRRSHRGDHRRPSTVTISSSTLDSDAAPLDSAAIVSHATNYAEEEVKRAERRERRRQRREMKRAAALALEQATILADGDEFEGFQGSGGGSRHMGLASSPPPLLGRDDGTRTGTVQDLRYTDDDDYDDDDEGDFGAGPYTRRASGSSDSGRGSDSRSRTSTTTSASGQRLHSGHSIQPYNHHYISQQPAAHTAATTDAALLPVRRTKNKSSRSSASKSSSSSAASSTKRSRSSPSAPLSPGLASPVASAAPLPTTTNTNTTTIPSTAPPRTAPQEAIEDFTSRGPRLQTAGIQRQTSGFPSPGIGGPRNGKRDMGAFLANRGDT